jgi:hypothetical protein
MQNKIIKFAGFDETEITDPETGLKIRVSITTRKVFRHLYKTSEDLGYSHMRNDLLNEVIAKDFILGAQKIVHRFKLKSGEFAEIRNKPRTVMFYISAIRDNTIDILTIQNGWKSPKYTKRYGMKNRE